MTRRAYTLETAAPRKFVWVWTCDVCQKISGEPAWTQDELASMEQMKAFGWRCLSNKEQDAARSAGRPSHYDTCPACIALEVRQVSEVEIMSIDDEGVRRAAESMRRAAEQMERAANLINDSMDRLQRIVDELPNREDDNEVRP